MSEWPKSAFVTCSMMAIGWVASLYYLHQETALNYREVGTNNGRIFQSYEAMNTINKLAPIPVCNHEKQDKNAVEFLTVKADSVFIIYENSVFRFCKN